MTKAERAHLDAVADLGCIVCFNEGNETPASIHHIRAGMGMGQRNTNLMVLPLCHTHHQTGPVGTAFHKGRQSWERNYGTESDLKEQVTSLLANA